MKNLESILQSVESICDKEVYRSSDFGIEFGTFAPDKIKATNIKGIIVSPFLNLKLIHYMNENKSNLAITGLPLPFTDNSFPLSERDFEMMKSLITNNLRTISLSKKWIYSPNGGITYFLQTLGITKIDHSNINLISGKTLNSWSIPDIKFHDFLASLTHLTKDWLAYSLAPEDVEMSFVLEKQTLTDSELREIKNEGISNIVGFAIDSRKIHSYRKHKMNFLFIPFIDFYNISLRKFSQVLQLETNEKVLFYAQTEAKWLNYQNIQNKSI
ncbi:MAG: hypothetical protein KAS63_06115 [Candidatus Heimdallarchaeota archaeon]|nr:hypothetical protein [Candidatus Heimdallarchaeota archaeon]MCK4954916.1 hypothetical protein [Candidatus Heimdallarchaeota archaeon]